MSEDKKFNTNLESHSRYITERTTALGAPFPVSLKRIKRINQTLDVGSDR